MRFLFRKKINSRLKKGGIITLIALTTIFLVAIACLSPFVKYFLEKQDQNLFGREVKMDWAYANPFTGFVHLHNVNLSEATGDSVFVFMKGVNGNINLFKLLSRTVEITNLTLKAPRGQVVQTSRVFNIDDLIERFSSSGSSDSRWKVTILGLSVEKGEFHFVDTIIPVHYFIKEVTLKSVSDLTHSDTLASSFSFLAGIGRGTMQGDFSIHKKTKDYRFSLTAHDFDMEIIRQYIWELINYGMFTAHVDATLTGHGNFNSIERIAAKGRFMVRDFHLGKTTEDDYLALKKLVVVMDELSPAEGIFQFDSVLFDQPYIKYERYDSLNNIETLLGKKGKNISDVTQQGRFNLVIEIARYVKTLSTNFFKSNYKVNILRVNDGTIAFNDFATSEKFALQMTPLSIWADSVNKQERVKVFMESDLIPFGMASVQLSINPLDSGDFDMNYKLLKIPTSLFNPYLITYTSFPMDRGTVELSGDWNVRNGKIKSDNHLLIVDPRISKRIRNDDMKWRPMPLIMALTREKGNVIDYQIPITGNLKDPNFHFADAIFDLIKNIFVKPPTTPYRMEVKDIENEIEQSTTMQWEMRQRNLDSDQAKFIKSLAAFLKGDSTASLSVYPITFADREREHILFFETKKKYFQLVSLQNENSFSDKDSLMIEKMSIKDKSLVQYLSKNLSDTVMFTLQEKCLNFVGTKVVQEKFQQLLADRERVFLSYFKSNGTDNQLQIHANSNEIPYNGFSNFRFEYKNGIPESLEEAYSKMNGINKKRSRKKYNAQREDQP